MIDMPVPKPFELSLDAKAHASFGQWDRVNREIAAALLAVEQRVWERLEQYLAMRYELADTLLQGERLGGNIVKEERERAALAELRGLQDWIQAQQAQGR